MRVVAIKVSVYALNVQAILYTATEISTTLVCTGIPACMPMYRSWFKSCLAARKNRHVDRFPLPLPECTIGGTPIVLDSRTASPKRTRARSWWSVGMSFCRHTNVSDEAPLSRFERDDDGPVLRDEGQLLGGEKEIQAATPSSHTFELQSFGNEGRAQRAQRAQP